MTDQYKQANPARIMEVGAWHARLDSRIAMYRLAEILSAGLMIISLIGATGFKQLGVYETLRTLGAVFVSAVPAVLARINLDSRTGKK